MNRVISVCLLAACAVAGCTSSQIMKSSAIQRGDVRLADFKYAIIHEATTASFMELELERLLEDVGLLVIGRQQVGDHPGEKVLAVRYLEESSTNGYGERVRTELTVTLEEFSTDRTLLTARGTTEFGSRSSAWKAVERELRKAFTE